MMLYILAFTFGIGLFLRLFFINQQKDIALRKTVKMPDDFEHKLSTEYSPHQRMYSLFIVLILLIPLILAVYLLFHGDSRRAQLILFFIIIAWFILIKLGNKVK